MDWVTKLRQQLEHHLSIYLRRSPRLGRGVFIARGAVVVGDVTLGDHASIWYNAVLRADLNRIIVGHHSNIQDNAVLHLSEERPCRVGHHVTVGHSAILHACTIGDETLIGMGAVILDGAVIGRQCLIGARALVTQRTRIPDGTLVLGTPARVVRQLTKRERTDLRQSAEHYGYNAAHCRKHRPDLSEPLTS